MSSPRHHHDTHSSSTSSSESSRHPGASRRVRPRDATTGSSKKSSQHQQDKIRQDWIDAVFGPLFFPRSSGVDARDRAFPPTSTSNSHSTYQGTGLAGIPKFVAYQATIPPPPQPAFMTQMSHSYLQSMEAARDPKLGLTLSHLTLGLWVQAVVPDSDAHWAGLKPNSILVSVNGMGLLVEPSRHALERLWQYEGLFQNSSSSRSSSRVDPSEDTTDTNSADSESSTSACNRPTMQDPVAMTLLHEGQLYTVLLLAKDNTRHSHWGIRWAACAPDLCLVNRAYSYASSVGGVRRGSIVARINQSGSLRDTTYSEFGTKLQALYEERQEAIQLWLCFPPAAGRTGYFERQQQQLEGRDKKTATEQPMDNIPSTTTNRKKKGPVVQTRNGVEVRVHSFGESWKAWREAAARRNQANNSPPKRALGSKFRSSSYNNKTRISSILDRSHNHLDDDNNDLPGSVAELANQVVMGEREAPTSQQDLLKLSRKIPHWSRQQRSFRPCPVLSKTDMLRVWNPLQAFVYCLHCHDYVLQLTRGGTPASRKDMTIHPHLQSAEETTALLKELATDHMVQLFLWQFISLIGYYQTSCFEHCHTTSLLPTVHPEGEANEADGDDFREEKKEDGRESNETHPKTMADATATHTPYLQSGTPHANNTSYKNNYAEILTSILLKLSRKDQDFCQRLYFCLRSTLKCLEVDDDTNSETSSRTASAAQQGTQLPNKQSNHLLALFNCLKLLRSAEIEAATCGHQGSVEQQYRKTSAASVIAPVVESSTIQIQAMDTSAADTSQLSITSSQKSEKRRLFGFFKKKKKNKSKKKEAPRTKAPPEAPMSPKKQSSSSLLQTQSLIPLPLSPRRRLSKHGSSHVSQQPLLGAPPTPLLENMSEFVKELDGICTSIEKKLLKSMSQKIAEWALQPWSASKSSVLHTLTAGMRESLDAHSGSPVIESNAKPRSRRKSEPTSNPNKFCLVNPLDSQELLVGVDHTECYILPSAHFPLLLTFDATERKFHPPASPAVTTASDVASPCMLQRGQERSYRIVVQISNLVSSATRLVLHGAVGGVIQESTSTSYSVKGSHCFGQKMEFCTKSPWGAPRTLALRLSCVIEGDDGDRNGNGVVKSDDGFGWIDLGPLWDRLERFQEPESFCTAKIYPTADNGFDDQGCLNMATSSGERVRPLRLECKVFTELLRSQSFSLPSSPPTHKRLLLYKHDDDLRQEAFAIQFVRTCDTILKASGLDLRLLTFGCIPVGTNRGFIEWVQGSVPLSDICQKPFSSIFGTRAGNASAADKVPSSSANDGEGENNADDDGEDDDDMSMIAKAGMTNYESLYRKGMAGVGNAAATAMQNSARSRQPQVGKRGALANNPIQDFLRSIAFDPEAPYFVSREAMDNFVKSCAGYCVITYVLGVGDRHLDNLLLHNQTGCFFHCDYSFLFGKDPKKYLPMRVTEDMIWGMGGRESDNFAKFLSLTGSAFLTLRQPVNVRLLLSLVRVMEGARLPDIAIPVSTAASDGALPAGMMHMADAILGMRERLRLDLTEEDAVAFMEDMIETSLSSKMWMAVDAIHSLGKRF